MTAQQIELFQPGPLLNPDGSLTQVGWSRRPLLECNLEAANVYLGILRPLQRFRIKRWDYYALFTPQRFFSATVADLGYAANVFVYTLDFATNRLHEEGLVLPAAAVSLPRGSDSGETLYEGKGGRLCFRFTGSARQLEVDWPGFDGGKGIRASLRLDNPPDHESMTIVIPIPPRRFYYNTKINCMPAQGVLQYGDEIEQVRPEQSLASLDWGRGVWEYRSFWNWASASGYLPDGRTVGLNLGKGFGDLSAAGENALILNGKIHKLGPLQWEYSSTDYTKPWRFTGSDGRVDLTLTPFKERTARSNLLVIFSEVHQMFGHYSGIVRADDGEEIRIDGLIGFAEEHHARW